MGTGDAPGELDVSPRFFRKLLGLVRGGSSLPQFVIDFLQKLFRFGGMSLHIPLIGLLRGRDFFVSLLAQPLSGCEIGMPRTRDILLGSLR